MKIRSYLPLRLAAFIGLVSMSGTVSQLKAGVFALDLTTVLSSTSIGYEDGLSEGYAVQLTTTSANNTSGMLAAWPTRVFWGNFGMAEQGEDGFQARFWASDSRPITFDGEITINVSEAIQLNRMETLDGTVASWTAESSEVSSFELTEGSMLEEGEYTLRFSFTPVDSSVTELNSAIFFTAVPEPAVSALGAFGGLLLLRRSRRVS